MSPFEAIYYDGCSSAGRNILIHSNEHGTLDFKADDFSAHYRFDVLQFSSRLAETPRFIYLPDGGKCETSANDEIDALIARFSARDTHSWLHLLESRWSWVVCAALFTLAFIWASFEYGLPYLAKKTANAIPIEIEFELGARSLQSLDRLYMKPTHLEEIQRERIHTLFRALVGQLDLPIQPQLMLRRSEILGANAFALPSGIVVITDALVELAENDAQLISVLAHELGHVQRRHIMRSILQNSAAALLLATVLGDVTSITGLAASIPAFLVQQRYSRDFEREADRYAVKYLKQAGIPIKNFTAMLENLDAQHAVEDEGQSNYLSSHPGTKERIKALHGHRPE